MTLQPDMQARSLLQKGTKKGEPSSSLVTVLDPASSTAEAYRTLCTRLLSAPGDALPKVVVITSPAGSAEGKSTFCANLGVVLAQTGKNTLVVDCDFRRPVMHEIFGLRSIRGVVDVLGGAQGLPEVCQEPLSGLSLLKVLTVGPPPQNPAELLGSQRLSEFFTNVRKQFDYVLIDSAPIGFVSDPIVLSIQGDGVLLTLGKKTRKEDLRHAMRSLEGVGANVLGTVMNNAKESTGGY
jgi:capsular exopolysaccharide synthesis family protein